MTIEEFEVETESASTLGQNDQEAHAPQSQTVVSQETESAEESETSEQESNSEESEALVRDEKPGKDANGGKKKGNGVQERINELTRLRRDAEAQAEYWRRQAEGKNSQSQEQKPAAEEKKASDGRPNRDDFETLADYNDAVVDWKFDQKLKAEKAEREQAEQVARQRSMIQTHDARVNEFKATQGDYDDVVRSFLEENPQFQVSQDLLETVIDSDLSAQISYELFKNPAELFRLNGLSGKAIAREIGKIEARLSLSTESQQTKTISKSKAPPPAKPVNSGSVSVRKSYDDMSFDEFMAARNAKTK